MVKEEENSQNGSVEKGCSDDNDGGKERGIAGRTIEKEIKMALALEKSGLGRKKVIMLEAATKMMVWWRSWCRHLWWWCWWLLPQPWLLPFLQTFLLVFNLAY